MKFHTLEYLELSLATFEKNVVNNPLASIALRCGVETKPLVGAGLLGSLLGLVGTLVSMLFIGTMLALLPREQWGNSAAAGLTGLSQGAFFFVAVVFTPMLETVMGQVMPIEFARRFGANWAVCILASAIVFGFGHYWNGGLVHGISAFLGGAVFASGYVAVRRVGFWSGLIAAYIAHATQNAMLLFVVAPLVPGFG